MATDIQSPKSLSISIPPLRNGDRLTQSEFLCRYRAMPNLHHAELFELLPMGDDGIYRSTVLPGLWLDPAAAMRGDLGRALEVLNRGIADLNQQPFVEQLKSAMA
jgi:hypothetical protein